MAHCDGFILTCVLVAWGGSAGAAQDLQQPERQKTVLTFYSARMGVPAVVSLDRAIEQTLAQGLKGRLDYHVEYLDLARFSDSAYQGATRDFLRAKYEHYRFDVIVATTNATLEFVTRYRDDLFPSTPVVFSSGPGTSGGANTTGVHPADDPRREQSASRMIRLRCRCRPPRGRRNGF